MKLKIIKVKLLIEDTYTWAPPAFKAHSLSYSLLKCLSAIPQDFGKIIAKTMVSVHVTSILSTLKNSKNGFSQIHKFNNFMLLFQYMCMYVFGQTSLFSLVLPTIQDLLTHKTVLF